LEQSTRFSEGQSFSGMRLYSPVTIAAYGILTSLPIGVVLYGINISRRGEIWFGRFLIAIGVLVLAGTTIAGILGSDVFRSQFMLVSIFGAIGLMKMEAVPYKKAIAKGALKAKWWSPLLWVIFTLGAISTVLYLFSPVEEMP
jgi:hypothetical protein